MSFWTQDKTQELKRLHKQGHSATQIGAAIGTTRNAVLGKLFRLGLCVEGGTSKRNDLRRRS